MASRISQMRSEAQLQPSQPQANQLAIEQVRNFMHQLKNTPNSQQLLLQVLQDNPNMQPLLNIMKSNGNLEIIAKQMAQSYGFNLSKIIQELLK